MENRGRLRRSNSGNEAQSLLKSSPNILENFAYDDFQLPAGGGLLAKRMSSPPVEGMAEHPPPSSSSSHTSFGLTRSATTHAKPATRSRSPKFCETLEKHAFMRNVINSRPTTSGGGGGSGLVGGSAYEARYSSPSEKEATVRRSLEEISKDIKEIEEFLTATEQVMRREKEQEREIALAKRRRVGAPRECTNKENKTPSPLNQRRASLAQPRRSSPPLGPPTFKINSFKRRGSTKKPSSPRMLRSKLYFRNGRIGCVEAEKNASNIESTHALVKHIIQYENEKPLVSPESVRRVLSGCANNNGSSGKSGGGIGRRFSVAATAAVTVAKLLHPRQPLPGEILDPQEMDRAAEAALRPLLGVADLAAATGKVILDDDGPDEEIESKGGAGVGAQPQSIVDEDEQDVQICYDELPEVPNEQQNNGPDSIEGIIMDSEMVIAAMPEGEEDGQDMAPGIASSNRLSSAGSLDSESQQFLRDQVRHLVRRFTARANKVKSRLELPPTPSSTASSPSPPPTAPGSVQEKNIGFGAGAKKSTKMPKKDKNKGETKKALITRSPNGRGVFEADTPRSNVWLCSTLCGSNNDERTLDPQGKIYISWLCVVSLSFLYNAWVIPLRSTFPFQTKENTNIWLACDFCADIIYLLDVVFFKHRIMYLFEGFWVKNKIMTRKNYMRKLQFKLDILALLPLELFYFKYGTKAVYFRFPRLFKIQSFWEVFKLLDRVISSPHFVRVAKTLTYMFFLIHVTACAYYAYSDYQGLGVNRWVFSGKGHPYVRCIAFSTKTATSIGKNPKPEREGEYVFMTAAWLMGVFVFALLIGQIRDIISTATRNKNEYRQLEDETLEYMRRLNLPKDVQSRVKMWFKFTWDQQRTLDEANILDSLPINLKTDIAISVHIQTLSKVQLFADCEEALLRDLVLKLRAVTFLPGDSVCRKGEVGREMYIIKLGQVQVMGGPNNDIVLATLSEGSVFGEISLLGINGADRRTADVCAKGFANLFVLSKSDLNEVIAYYPSAQAILKKRARTLMRKNAAREREEKRAQSALQADVVIGNPKTPETPPKLLQTVIQALPYESPAVILITRGSKRLRRQRKSSQMETIEDREVEEPNDDAQKKNCSGAEGPALQRKRSSVGAARDSFMLRHEEKRSNSPDLLSSIQNELKTKNRLINLTDSEKALIISGSSNNSIEQCKDEMASPPPQPPPAEEE